MAALERALGESDIEQCMRLVAEAGWNQTANDWKTIFQIGEARGLFNADALIASAAIVRHDPVGWICMVLVAPSEQRRGHATRLLNWAGERLKELGLIAGLDATPAGRNVYLPLGYHDIYPITRLQAATPLRSAGTPPALAARSIGVGDVGSVLGSILALDRRAFGADRGELLASLIRRRPDIATAAFEGDECVGFVLAREGLRATQLGPVVARDEDIAIALLDGALRTIEGAVFIDAPDRHLKLRAWLEAHGFTAQRPFMRMLRGCDRPFDDSSLIFALTGPEFA